MRQRSGWLAGTVLLVALLPFRLTPASDPAPESLPGAPAAPSANPGPAPVVTAPALGSTGQARVRRRDHAGALEALTGASRAVGSTKRDERGPRSRLHVALLEGAGALVRQADHLQIADVTHTPYALSKHGHPVFNRRGRLHASGDPELAGVLPAVTGWTGVPRPEPADWRIHRAQAIRLARSAAGVLRERVPPRARQGWLALEGRTVPAWRVQLASHLPAGLSCSVVKRKKATKRWKRVRRCDCVGTTQPPPAS